MSKGAATFLRWLALAALCACGGAQAQATPDLAREKRWADQVLGALVLGDPVWLEAAGRRFLALHAPAMPSRGAVILAHGPGQHPDFGLTGELRVALHQQGFSTLSLQMPVLGAEAEAGAAYRDLYPDAIARFDAALAWLAARGVSRPAVVSHAMGSGMTHAWLHRRPAPALGAWVALSFYGEFQGLDGIRFPVFDLYGASDYRGIRGPADERKAVLDRLPGSRQLALPEGGRFLAGGESGVLREVAAFLGAAYPRAAR